MLKINDLTNTLSTTWDSLSQGWDHLINNASNALTHFASHDDKSKTDNTPSYSPNWGLISADLFDDIQLTVDQQATVEDAAVRKFALVLKRLSLAAQEENKKVKSGGGYCFSLFFSTFTK